MQPHVIKFGCGSNTTPGLFEVDEVPSRPIPTDHVRIAFEPGNLVKQGQRRSIQTDSLASRL